MKLKTLISIVSPSTRIEFTFSDKNELDKTISDILDSFSGCDEPLTPKHIILEYLFSISGPNQELIDKIVDIENRIKTLSDIETITIFEQILKYQKNRSDLISVSLTPEEMYNLFSLSEFRKLQMEKLNDLNKA